MTLKQALKVPCPRCNADIGKPCVSSNGGLMRTAWHAARRHAAEQAKAAK